MGLFRSRRNSRGVYPHSIVLRESLWIEISIILFAKSRHQPPALRISRPIFGFQSFAIFSVEGLDDYPVVHGLGPEVFEEASGVGGQVHLSLLSWDAVASLRLCGLAQRCSCVFMPRSRLARRSNQARTADPSTPPWLPVENKCWYVNRVVEVKREYELSVDQAESDAIERALVGCESGDMVGPWS